MICRILFLCSLWGKNIFIYVVQIELVHNLISDVWSFLFKLVLEASNCIKAFLALSSSVLLVGHVSQARIS